MTKIRLVATDLDGTFWHGHEVIHPDTRAAVDELARRGVDLMIATGRRLQAVRRGMVPAGIDRPAVLMSGAIGADIGSGEEWHRHGFDATAASDVLAAFRAHDLEPVTYFSRQDREAIAAPTCSSAPAHLASFGRSLERTDPTEHVRDGTAVGFGIIGTTHPALHEVARSLAGVANVWHQVDDTYGGWTLMVGPPDVTKLTALEPWCARHGYARDEVLAVGDGSNDFAMMDWAGVAVAVEDRPTVDRPHDAVIRSPEVGGWAGLLDLV